MTHLRTMTIEDLCGETIPTAHVNVTFEPSRVRFIFRLPPGQIRSGTYPHLPSSPFSDKKLSPNTVNQRLAALRFLLC